MPVAEYVPLVESLSALADPARCRVMRLLDGHELTVSEICAVLQLPQSTVSRHLRTLGDASWVTSRREGTSRYYGLAADQASGPARAQIWALMRAELAGRPAVDQDARRLARVLARRSETSQKFFATAAGQWDRLREDLFGSAFSVRALLAFLPRSWTVADLGCGTGTVVAELAPWVNRVIGVDASEDMLSAARARVRGATNVDLRCGPVESLPIESGSVDAVTVMLVLHHLAQPSLAVKEAHRVVVPGGRLVVVEMAPHDREEYRRQMGHVWLGFSDDQLRRLLDQAGFTGVRVDPLPAVTEGRGPELVVATGVR